MKIWALRGKLAHSLHLNKTITQQLQSVRAENSPVVRPEGPAARDSGSSAAQQSHVCFWKPPALQLTGHSGNALKTTACDCVDFYDSGLIAAQKCLICFQSIHSHISESVALHVSHFLSVHLFLRVRDRG